MFARGPTHPTLLEITACLISLDHRLVENASGGFTMRSLLNTGRGRFTGET